MNISINGIGNQNTQQQVKATVSTVNAPKEEKKGMTVFAGNLNMGQDPVKEKLESARKQAFKMVSDAWNTDRDFQKRLQDLKDFVAEQRSEKASAQQMANDAEKTMKDLKEEYDPDPESDEQKDLEWIMAWRKQPLEEKLNNPDFVNNVERSKEIMKNLTEYQSRMLEADGRLTAAKQRIDEADKAMVAATQSFTDAES
nr:hypothetical protein [Lachnospiraceae bacterium]